MTARWYVSPEVAGELGEHTDMNTTVHPPKVYRLHYQFQGWLGDDLLEAFPCFLVSRRLAEAIKNSDLTGWRLGNAELTRSPEFEEMYPDRDLPEFLWLQVDYAPAADISISADGRLDVSERALELLRRFSIENAVVEPIEPDRSR
jgi:hypothetical protein